MYQVLALEYEVLQSEEQVIIINGKPLPTTLESSNIKCYFAYYYVPLMYTKVIQIVLLLSPKNLKFYSS